MITVTNQTELRNALAQGETDIAIANDFTLSTTLNIESDVTLHSLGTATFTLLKSATFFGYILRVRNGGSLTLKNIIIDGNKANHPLENTTNRSLLYVAGGTLQLQEDAIVQNNITYLEGGGIYLSGSVDYVNHFVMESNAIIRGCYARTNGGGIVAAIRNREDSVIIGGQAQIEENDANFGGGIYYRIYTAGVKGSLTISDMPTFQNNHVRNSGGAIAVVNIAANTENINVEVTGRPAITDNIASNHGAGIYFVGTNARDELHLGTARIERNIATNYGGGVYLNEVLATFTGTFFNSNKGGTGGGLYALSNAGGTLELATCDFLYNQASNGVNGSGGGIFVNNRSTTLPFNLTIRDSELYKNTASATGGGLYFVDRASGLTALLERVNIQQNTATTNGAGLFLAAAGIGTLQILQSTITENRSDNYGGGLYLSNENEGIATLLLRDCEVLNNQAEVQGGGLRLSSGQGQLEATLEDCKVAKNLASTNSGGGLWCGGNRIFVTLSKTTTVEQNETIEGNGGGIYFNSQTGILRLNDECKVINNLANQNTNVIRNRGGGIYLVPGIFYIMGNSEIAGNKAKYGGGLATGEGAKVTIAGGNIHDNEATWGGGIHNQASTIDFKSGNLYDNQAMIGGGIYNE